MDWHIVYENGKKSPATPSKEAAMHQAGGDLRRMTPPQPSHIEGPNGESVSLIEIKAYYVTHKTEFT